MESNSIKGFIHVSQATADELIKKGKGHWLKAREEKIVAKGKGEMQTYFVSNDALSKSIASSRSRSSYSGSSFGDDEDEEEEEKENGDGDIEVIEEQLKRRLANFTPGESLDL